MCVEYRDEFKQIIFVVDESHFNIIKYLQNLEAMSFI